MAVPKFIMKMAAKKAVKKLAKAALQRQDKVYNLGTLKEIEITSGDNYKAVKKPLAQSKDKEKILDMTTPGIKYGQSALYKMIPEDADGLLKMVQSEKGKDVVKERFGYTQMPDGNPITRKCSYNSKRKK